ncbi:MAG: DUF3575 domain-containing protein [Bacteroidota bacterium]
MRHFFISILIFIIVKNINAQETVAPQNQAADTIPRNNEISLVLSDMLDGSLQFRYERKTSENMTVGLGASFKSKLGMVSFKPIDNEKLQLSGLQYSGLKIVPDVRYYLEKTRRYDMDGFYFGGYLRYSHYGSNLYGTYISDQHQHYGIDMDIKMNIITVGLMVGYKLALSENFNIDFIFAGPGEAFHMYAIENRLVLPNDFYDDLNEVLQDYSLFDFINSDFRFKLNSAKTNFFTSSFRYGITVGYTF